MHHVTRTRSIVKALSWRLLGALDTFALSYFLTGHAALAGAIVSVEFFTKTALYYAHERGWDLLQWGHLDGPPPLNRLRRLGAQKGNGMTRQQHACPYCGKSRTRLSCQSEWMAKGVLPACSSGPRYDAPEREKMQFHAWLDTQTPEEALR